MKRRKILLLVLSAAGVAVVLAAFGITMLLMSGERQPTPDPATRTEPGAPPVASGCSSDTSAIALDPAKVPEPGTALRDTLTSAIARYFRCSSVPFDQLARTFATISVIVPHYVTDEKCFQGESRIVQASWADHKGWADRQAREELLRVSLHRTIENTLACLRPAEQRLFFTDVARASAYVTSRFASQTFVDPSLKGQRVDRCLYYARECNEPAALAWCQQHGFARMTRWEWVYIHPTYTLGDRKTCLAQGCAGFSTIVCGS